MDDLIGELNSLLVPKGFEIAPFKVKWYNETVQDAFRLDHPPETLAVSVISAPSMYEKTFMPFVCSTQWTNSSSPVRDPLDYCIKHQLQEVQRALSKKWKFDVIHDYDVDFSRKPRILVQTAGHVAGQAFYYQRHHVSAAPWSPEKRIYGVSIHPKYGGWFAFRGVLIFNMTVPDLVRVLPQDVVSSDEKKMELLEQFNDNWQDWKYRDIIPVEERYSEEQKTYFATAPGLARRSLLGLPTLDVFQ